MLSLTRLGSCGKTFILGQLNLILLIACTKRCCYLEAIFSAKTYTVIPTHSYRPFPLNSAPIRDSCAITPGRSCTEETAIMFAWIALELPAWGLMWGLQARDLCCRNRGLLVVMDALLPLFSHTRTHVYPSRVMQSIASENMGRCWGERSLS
jgi:hypothetical protein